MSKVQISVSSALPAVLFEPSWMSPDVSFYMSAPWLRYVHHELTDEVFYLSAVLHGAVVATLPIYPGQHGPRYTIGRFDPGLAAGRYAIGGGVSGYWSGVCWSSALDPKLRSEVLRRLIVEARRHVAELGLDGLAMLYLPASDLNLLSELGPHDSLDIALDAVLPFAFESFDEYLAWLPSRKRRQVKSDLASMAGEDVVVTRHPLSDTIDELAPMVSNVQRKYGIDDSPEACYSGLTAQARWLDALTHTFIARNRHGEALGGALYYEYRNALYGRLVGFAANYPEKLYFQLYFYEPIRLACQLSSTNMYFGLEGLQAKQKRGADVRHLGAVVFD